jgi:alpha-L-fucosidase 2
MTRHTALLALALSARLTAAPATPPGEWILWYDQPASAWDQALPVGNGRLGAMVFGGTATEKIQFNEHTVWTGQPHNYAHPGAVKVLPELRELLWAGKQREAESLAMKEFMSQPVRQKAYQPCGDLLIETPGGQTTAHRRWLDLDSGLAVTEWTAGETVHRRETFASHPANLIVTRLSASRPHSTTATIRLDCPHREHSVTIADSNTLVLAGKVQADGVAFEARALVIATGGKLSAEDGAISVRNADSIEIRLTAATNVANWRSLAADPAKQARETLARTSATGHATLMQQHLEDHRALFRKVSLDLGRTPAAALTTNLRIEGFRDGDDPQLAALLFQYGRYLLIGSSREGGQPANLQGIWNASMKPPWDSKYTCNINTQMNYWPAESTHLAPCHQALFQALAELRESGAITAREHYGARGWVLHHNFDLWRGTAPINASNHGIWPTGGAWLSLHLWEHFRYSGDQAFLRQAWPVLRDSALFFTDYLSPHPVTKALVSGPSNSPEQGGLVMGPTMDHQIIRELFKACSQAAGILGTDAAFAAELDRLRPLIAPNKIGQHGQLQEWLEDVDDPKNKHRHVSHLWGVFPGADITWRQPDLFQAARQSLIHRGDAATGWSMGWKTNLWARFLDGDHAHLILSNLLQPVGRTKGQGGLYPNLFDAHPPFQIDGNFGATSGIAEMLLQSHVPADGDSATPRHVIHLLPALPKAWPTGSVTGLRARGGLTIDLAWRDGKLTKAVLTPATAGPITVRLGERTTTLTGQAGQALTWDGAR